MPIIRRTSAALVTLALATSACGLGDVPASSLRPTLVVAHPPFAGWWDGASPAGTVVELSSDVLFAVDSAVVFPAGLDALRSVAAQLVGFTGQVAVIGFTDDTGTPAHNLALSLERAQAVAAVLKSMGRAPSRVTAVGRGESDPLASNDTAAGRSQNRRVEIDYFAPSSTAQGAVAGASQ